MDILVEGAVDEIVAVENGCCFPLPQKEERNAMALYHPLRSSFLSPHSHSRAGGPRGRWNNTHIHIPSPSQSQGSQPNESSHKLHTTPRILYRHESANETNLHAANAGEAPRARCEPSVRILSLAGGSLVGFAHGPAGRCSPRSCLCRTTNLPFLLHFHSISFPSKELVSRTLLALFEQYVM